MPAPGYTETERRQFKLNAQRKSWGLASAVDCDTCKVHEGRRCVDMRKDHEGRLLNWPHTSRMEKAWASLAEWTATRSGPDFADLKDPS